MAAPPRTQAERRGLMNCLLCQVDGTRITPDGDHWTAACPRCGRYCFDAPFAELVKHAHANGDTHLLQQLNRVAAAVRRSRELMTIRRDNLAELLERTPAG